MPAAAVPPDAPRSAPRTASGGWPREGYARAFAAFRRSAENLCASPGRDPALLAAALLCLAMSETSEEGAEDFFRTAFSLRDIEAPGFVTGYFEPEVAASRMRAPGFDVPLYRLPPRRAESVAATPRPTRAEIEDGAFSGRGLELAWLADPVDAFFIHVQGSARLRLADGGLMRVGFAGRNMHPYTSIGRLAVERGLLTREAADMRGLEAWLRADPQRGRDLMRENRSFIFFREQDALGAEDGPLGAAGVPLTPLASLAVDPQSIPFHYPVIVSAPDLDSDLGTDAASGNRGAGFRRVMIAQDRGSAIRGPARGDLFIGSGDAAGSIAGRIRHAAHLAVLHPRPQLASAGRDA